MPKLSWKHTHGKAKKPRPDFPLFPHATGRWAKKVRGKMHYFGKVADDPQGQAALGRWLDQRDDLLAGRTPRVGQDGLQIRDLCNRFLTAKQHKMESGELAESSFADYYDTCEGIVAQFGATRLVEDLAPSDFQQFRAAMAKKWGPVTIGNEIQRVRVVFRFATENELIAGRVHYGGEFQKPSKKVLRAARATHGLRMFEAAELRKLIASAGVPMKAMILLAINCGFGNSDIANLTKETVNLKAGWIDFPRPKTGIARRCPLWRETIAAITTAFDCRPKPREKTDDGLVFVTRCGGRWARMVVDPLGTHGKPRMYSDDAVGKEFSKLIKRLKLHKPGLGFYALRHTFETIGGDSKDQVAVDHIMGHAPAANDMASVYRERISDERLKAVVEHVRKWLYGSAKTNRGGLAGQRTEPDRDKRAASQPTQLPR